MNAGPTAILKFVAVVVVVVIMLWAFRILTIAPVFVAAVSPTRIRVGGTPQPVIDITVLGASCVPAVVVNKRQCAGNVFDCATRNGCRRRYCL